MFVGLLPDDSENHLIKRVIGLPGDHVVCCDEGGRVTVNGEPLVRALPQAGRRAERAGLRHHRARRARVWVMGDHRSDSSDSRFHDATGNGERRVRAGRASSSGGRWPSSGRWTT